MIDVAIVGAGLSGLACARTLVTARRTCAVLERSRGVGGRCATRRVFGQPIDHGCTFLHGSDPEFMAAIRAVPGVSPLEDWPRLVAGDGSPCQPRAFQTGEQRIAYAEGMTVFPKALATGVDVKLQTEVTALEEIPGGVRVVTNGGRGIEAGCAVLALPIPASQRLLESLHATGRECEAVRSVLGLVGTQASLTWIAGYPRDVPAPSWDVCYPGESEIVQMISHDSTKRPSPEFHVLVVQARPSWSRAHLDRPEADWGAEIARELERIVGSWAARSAWSQTHRWRFARSDSGTELRRSLQLRLPRGGRVIFTGESFAPGGGVEAAWLAGNESARRLMEEE